jgi:hypothetical protein
VRVLQRGLLPVRVVAPGAQTVRVRAVGRTGRPVARARSARLRHGRARVRLPLTRSGRRLLASCPATAFTLAVRTGRAARRRTVFCRRGRLGLRRPHGVPSLPYQVGIAVRPLNPCPTDGTWRDAAHPCGGAPVYLGGYGFAGGPIGAGPVQAPGPIAGRPATGILASTDGKLRDADGAHVRALAISDGAHPLLLADMELQGWFVADKLPGVGIVDMRRQVAHDLGISAQQVFIQSDHSHGGADAIGVWGGVPDGFLRYMARQTVTALERAYVGRRPARLLYGSADGAKLLNNQFSRDPANQAMDTGVRVLQARDARGRAVATLLNFSAHGTVLGSDNAKLTGDWPQAANALLERRFGGRAMTIVGTLGRTQPVRDPAQKACPGTDAKPAVAFCRIDHYGREVVARAGQALAHAKPLRGHPQVAARSYLITDPSSNAVVLGGDAAGGPLGIPIMRSTAPPWLTGDVLGTVTGSARVGNVLLSAVPGEIYPQIALKVAGTVKGIRPGGFMTMGLANDQLGYLIAPLEAYPDPVEQSLFSQPLSADVIGACLAAPGTDTCPTPDPVGNDNYLFNVSHTIGERVTCALLRGADDLLHPGRTTFRDAYDRCGLFPDDAARAPGADVSP